MISSTRKSRSRLSHGSSPALLAGLSREERKPCPHGPQALLHPIYLGSALQKKEQPLPLCPANKRCHSPASVSFHILGKYRQQLNVVYSSFAQHFHTTKICPRPRNFTHLHIYNIDWYRINTTKISF